MDTVVVRESELRAVREFIERPHSGAAALVLVGEAGIGKTVIWETGVRQAAARGMRVLVSQPVAAERQLAHVGIADLFEGVLDDLLPALAEPRRHALEVALLLAEAGSRPPDQRAVAAAVLSALRLLAERGPVLVAVDDAHWLDQSSDRALRFALRRAADLPVLLLLTRRTGLSGSAPEEALAPEYVEKVTVGPLSLRATHRLLQAHLESTFRRPTLVRLHEASGGNPFFALELARSLARNGAQLAAGEPFPVPESLELLVRDRLAALPKSSRSLLLVVAASAEPSCSLLNQGWPGASAALERARRAGVIVIDGDRVSFSHPLLSSVMYEQAARADLARRTAAWQC